MSDRRALAVIHYDPLKRDLLRDCLVGVTRDLQALPELAAVYLQRHWKHGPQIQIRMTRRAGQWPPAGIDAAVSAIEAYLAARPSETVLDESAYLEQSQRLGEAELELPPYHPVWPNNTVRLFDIDDDGRMLGSVEALLAKEELFHRSVGWLEGALAQAAPAATRVDLCWRLLAVAAAGYPDGGLLSGQMSLLSHVEDYLLHADPQGTLRRGFQERLQRLEPSLLPRFRELAQACQEHRYAGTDPVLVGWQQLLDWGWPRATALVEQGKFAAYGDTGTDHVRRAEQFGEAVLRRWSWGEDRPYSEFHQLLRQLNHRPEGVGVVEFGSYRFLLNHAYQLLSLLDVSPLERYFACYLVSKFSEIVFGKTSTELIREGFA